MTTLSTHTQPAASALAEAQATVRALMRAHRGPAVLTIGTFDGVHAGHRALLTHATGEARRRGVRLIAITFSPRPDIVVSQSALPNICTLRQRVARLRHAGADAVIVIPFTRELMRVTRDNSSPTSPTISARPRSASVTTSRSDRGARERSARCANSISSTSSPSPCSHSPGKRARSAPARSAARSPPAYPPRSPSPRRPPCPSRAQRRHRHASPRSSPHSRADPLVCVATQSLTPLRGAPLTAARPSVDQSDISIPGPAGRHQRDPALIEHRDGALERPASAARTS